MRRLVLLVAVSSAALSLGACKGQVQVLGQLVHEGQGAPSDTTVLSDLVVSLVPFDRDLVFDSLSKAYSTPEPPIPDSILKLQQSVADAQTAWQAAEQTWQQARDSLENMSKQMQRMNRASAEYRVMFATFNTLDSKQKDMRAAMDAAFKQFTDLQGRFAQESQEVSAQREQWADQAFAHVDSVMATKMDQAGRKEVVDTTSSTGVAIFNVKTGKWWVYARYSLPYNELYWNVPIDVTRGKPTVVILNRSNAQVRPKL
jgi:hypothetical protein